MLSKEIILKEITNEEVIVKEAIFEYICNLHLYDDEEINKALIKFLASNYMEINLAPLLYSKLNKEIIECLIKISLDTKSDYIKIKISDILINHYNLIKDMDYQFEKILQIDEDILLYKKITHFSKKDPTELIQLYKNNLKEYYFLDNDTHISEIMRKAIATALVQTDEGYNKLSEYINYLKENNDIEELVYNHMPYLIYPLCQCHDTKYKYLILNLYFNNLDDIDYEDECNYYFSNIPNEELEKFIDIYIQYLKKVDKGGLEEYYYDLAEYLNSEKIDVFLLDELKRNRDKEIKANIIRILAKKFNKEIIPYALNIIKTDAYYDVDIIKEALAPLLILEKNDEQLSKDIIQEIKNHENWIDEAKYEFLYDLLNDIQNYLLKDEPHIKEYRRIRNIHDDMMSDMVNYLISKNFKIADSRIGNNINYMNTKFDITTELGLHAIANILVYKNLENIKCVTEIFKEQNRYKGQEKLDMLDSMLNSEAGLFEIFKTDRKKGFIYLRNVLNDKEYCITDVGMSSNVNNDIFYLYTRIIQYQGISFGTALNIPFNKDDEFINKWIKENKEVFNQKAEVSRFMELYNSYLKDNKNIIALSKNL